MSGRFRAAVLALPLLAVSCSPDVDLKQVLQVTDVSTGFHDAGIVDGKNRLVPSTTFRITRAPDADVQSVALTIAFRAEGADDNLDEVFLQRVPIGPDGRTEPIVARSSAGFTGEAPQSRADMLKNSNFRDITVKVFVKQSSSQWIELHTVKVERRLLTQ
jgi:hypothetical protein